MIEFLEFIEKITPTVATIITFFTVIIVALIIFVLWELIGLIINTNRYLMTSTELKEQKIKNEQLLFEKLELEVKKERRELYHMEFPNKQA